MAKTKAKSELKQAEEYFCKCMSKRVFAVIEGRHYEFFRIPAQGWCYYLTAWGIMGLESHDRRVVGTINESLQSKRDYKHAWLEFKHNGKWYVYDTSKREVFSLEEYYKQYKPRKITSKLTQNKILKTYLKPESVVTIIEGDEYVFKNISDEEDRNSTEDDGYLRDAIGRGHLYVWSQTFEPGNIDDYSTEVFIAARK